MNRVIPEAEAYIFASAAIAEEVGRQLNVLRVKEACKRPRYHHIQIQTAGPVLCIIYKGWATTLVDATLFESALMRTGHSYNILTKG